MSDATAVVWFRRDLRLHDNEALTRAASAARVVPTYCFDPRSYGRAAYGGEDSFAFEKTGGHRTRFRRESVTDLRERLRERGADLVVRHERPERALPAVVDAVDAGAVYLHTLPGPEERATEARVKAALDDDVAVHRYWGHTLHHVNDLPTDYRSVDDTFTPFREAVEAESRVREPLGTPDVPPLPPDAPAPGAVPDHATLGVERPPSDDRAALRFEGGERAALDRLETYVWDRDCLREYRETRNGLVGADYSSKLSPWLNEGCLSPRRVHDAVRRYEDRRVENESTYWLLFELRWRDFFQFQVAKHGATFFTRGGIRRRDDVDWRDGGEALDRFRRGETGVPFVDAGVRELNATGYLSNRARQNVASFLANDLRVDWRKGAAHFETHLVDYDPASNYGNWAYVAGVGNDSRDRSFDVLSQARRYDPDAAYVKRWCPELDPLPPEAAHAPWTLTDEELAAHGLELGVDYPEPAVDPATV
ncbi:MAG: DASH family cryptochrome [Haloferacaceae archaeon]